MRAPLLLPAVAFSAGVAATRLVWFEALDALWPLLAYASLAAVAQRLKSRALARTSIILAFLFAGILTAVLHRPGPPPELTAESGEVAVLGGCIVEPPVQYEDRLRFVLELAPAARARVTLYFQEGEAPPRLRYGQQVELEARVRKPRNFRNPGAFDHEGYLARRHIYWTAAARPGTTVQVVNENCGFMLPAAVYGLREIALERLDRLYPADAYANGMLRATLIGDKSRLERVWTDHFRYTGTYHAIVISGLHLTALAAVLLFVFRVWPALDFAVLPLACALSWLYTALTGWQTPVIRAAVGLTLYLAARFFFRRPQLLNIIAVTALAFLALDPEQLFEASFQLSFLSVLAIAALAVPILERTSLPIGLGLRDPANRDKDLHLAPRVAQFRVELRLLAETLSMAVRLPERSLLAGFAVLLRVVLYVYELAVVSSAVQLGLVLPMALYFHRVSFTGLSANILVVPLMTLVVPIGFLAIFTGWQLPTALTSWLLAASRTVVDFHADLEPAWRIPEPPLWLAVATSAALVRLCFALRGRRGARWTTAAVLAGLLAVLLVHPFRPATLPGNLELTAIDVGQGESLFVAFPEGNLLLMDAGGFVSYGRGRVTSLDIGEDVVSPYLWSRSVRRLDVLVMSHAHQDHAGGLEAVMDNFRPAELWTGAVPDAPAWRKLREKAARTGVRVRRFRAGEEFHFGGARILVLAPAANYEPSAQPRNSDSLALLVRYGARSFVLAGEIDAERETELASWGLPTGGVLKVAHHGSRTSSTEEFLETLRPVFALVSAAKENRFGYPHKEVISRLARVGATTLETGRLGAVTVRTDGRRLWAEAASWAGSGRRWERVFEAE